MNNQQEHISREELQAQLPPDFPPLPEEITPQTMQNYVNMHFGGQMPPNMPPLPREFTAASLGAYFRQNFGGMLMQGGAQMARSTFWGFVLSYMPIRNEFDRQRVQHKLARGERVGPFEFVTGRRLTRGRIIGWIISLIVLAVVAYFIWQFNQTGELPGFLQ